MRFNESGMILCDGIIHKHNFKWRKRIDYINGIPITLEIDSYGKVSIYIFAKGKYIDFLLWEAHD